MFIFIFIYIYVHIYIYLYLYSYLCSNAVKHTYEFSLWTFACCYSGYSGVEEEGGSVTPSCDMRGHSPLAL